VLLADVLVQVSRAHPCCQGLPSAPVAALEKVAHSRFHSLLEE
jgi:hypothetical protein